MNEFAGKKNDVQEETTEIEAVSADPQKMLPQLATMWNDAKMMQKAWRTAEMLSKSEIIPMQYRGRTGDCLIAIDMANRIGISPIMVMQSSQIVKGNFTWRGTACKAFIDGCGKFKDSEYVFVGEKGTNGYGCYLSATSTKTGKTVNGATITIQTAIDEGWATKPGSKWKTFPDQMLRYRAAAFFARSECPEVLMGFYTADEIEDVKGAEIEAKETVTFTLPSAKSKQ